MLVNSFVMAIDHPMEQLFVRYYRRKSKQLLYIVTNNGDHCHSTSVTKFHVISTIQVISKSSSIFNRNDMKTVLIDTLFAQRSTNGTITHTGKCHTILHKENIGIKRGPARKYGIVSRNSNDVAKMIF